MFLEKVTTKSNVAQMTSSEIADLVLKRHDNVKRTIETLAGKGVIEFPQIEEIKTATRPAAVYVFSGEKGKRDSLVVVAQLSPEFTGAIVDRWIELERKASNEPAYQLPTTYLEALEQLVEKEKKLLAAQPKINYYDTVVERSTLLNATEVATKIGLTAQKLNKLLEAKGVYDTRIKRSKSFRHWFIEAGYGQTRQTPSGHPQSLFTTKGEAWIIETFSKGVA